MHQPQNIELDNILAVYNLLIKIEKRLNKQGLFFNLDENGQCVVVDTNIN